MGMLTAVLEPMPDAYEILFVDDASTDRSFELLSNLVETDQRLKVIRLRRVFGQNAALAAGFDEADSTVVISMNGDLQHAPEDIPALLEKIEEGYDIASGWRKLHSSELRLPLKHKSIAGFALAKSLTGSVHALFAGTERVRQGDFTHKPNASVGPLDKPPFYAMRNHGVTLVTYDSFALSKKTLADFTKKTGIKVNVVRTTAQVAYQRLTQDIGVRPYQFTSELVLLVDGQAEAHPELSLGSYPFGTYQQGEFGTQLVVRGRDQAMVDAAAGLRIWGGRTLCFGPLDRLSV